MSKNNIKMLSDIKALREQEDAISTDAAIQLIMTSMISLNDTMDKLSDDFSCHVETNKLLQDRIRVMTEKVDVLVDETAKTKVTVNELVKEIDIDCKSKDNPMISLGCFIKNHTKLFLFFVSMTAFLFFLAAIPQVKHSIIIFMGFPKEFADFISPIAP